MCFLAETTESTAIVNKRAGSNHKCENTGNAEHSVASVDACKSEALDNNAPYFSYYNGNCFWSTTCDSPKTGTGWAWDIYEIQKNSGRHYFTARYSLAHEAKGIVSR